MALTLNSGASRERLEFVLKTAHAGVEKMKRLLIADIHCGSGQKPIEHTLRMDFAANLDTIY